MFIEESFKEMESKRDAFQFNKPSLFEILKLEQRDAKILNTFIYYTVNGLYSCAKDLAVEYNFSEEVIEQLSIHSIIEKNFYDQYRNF